MDLACLSVVEAYCAFFFVHKCFCTLVVGDLSDC